MTLITLGEEYSELWRQVLLKASVNLLTQPLIQKFFTIFFNIVCNIKLSWRENYERLPDGVCISGSHCEDGSGGVMELCWWDSTCSDIPVHMV